MKMASKAMMTHVVMDPSTYGSVTDDGSHGVGGTDGGAPPCMMATYDSLPSPPSRDMRLDGEQRLDRHFGRERRTEKTGFIGDHRDPQRSETFPGEQVQVSGHSDHSSVRRRTLAALGLCRPDTYGAVNVCVRRGREIILVDRPCSHSFCQRSSQRASCRPGHSRCFTADCSTTIRHRSRSPEWQRMCQQNSQHRNLAVAPSASFCAVAFSIRSRACRRR